MSVQAALWPRERAGEALHELACAAGLGPRQPSRVLGGSDDVQASLEDAAAELDLEIEPAIAPYSEVDALLAGAGPALLSIDGRLAALLSTRGGRTLLLAPDARRIRVPTRELREAFAAHLETDVAKSLEPVLDAAEIRSDRRARARSALLLGHLGNVPVGGAWLLRLPPGRPILEQARRERLVRRLVAIVGASFLAGSAVLAAWIALGRGALEGRLDPAWIAAWILCLSSALPLRWLEGWLQADFALVLGALLKRRLLCGAARLDAEDVRGEGSGALLGRVLESEALESLALAGGFLLVGAAIDLALATWALAHAPAAGFALLALAAWTTAAILAGARQVRRAKAFAVARRALTEDLVERMVGHKTRIAQEPPERWHVEEDRRLVPYVERSRDLDRASILLSVLIPGAFVLSSLAVLAWAYVSGASAPAALAIGVGATLLGQQALSKLTGGLAQLAVCVAAWSQVEPLYRAAERREDPGLPADRLRKGAPSRSASLLSARGVSFRHRNRGRAALADLDLDLARGEKVLVEGPSGGGKSTLASLLAGWRVPEAGSVRLGGLDLRAWGASGWRARVAAAPQFHENRIFTGSLLFNLLLGTASGEGDSADEERALRVCRDLGLADLVARMPSGLRQLVGETGWQLSHGERGRVFVARALLAGGVAGGNLVVLDESLAGLDPESARGVLDALLARPEALVLMAHP